MDQARYRLSHNPPDPSHASIVAKFIDANEALASASQISSLSARPTLLACPGLTLTANGSIGLNLPRFLSDDACEGKRLCVIIFVLLTLTQHGQHSSSAAYRPLAKVCSSVSIILLLQRCVSSSRHKTSSSWFWLMSKVFVLFLFLVSCLHFVSCFVFVSC